MTKTVAIAISRGGSTIGKRELHRAGEVWHGSQGVKLCPIYVGRFLTALGKFYLPRSETGEASDDVLALFIGIENRPLASLVVGGVASRGGTPKHSSAGRFITGLGDPDQRVPGNVGDLFQRLDGKAGETFYLKETGNGSVTGWVKNSYDGKLPGFT